MYYKIYTQIDDAIIYIFFSELSKTVLKGAILSYLMPKLTLSLLITSGIEWCIIISDDCFGGLLKNFPIPF